ncbi:DUF368 domain-containing protein [Shouchella lonarensis]|uniref:Putative membrane protein n=1 Tax=Shouchella lonarensis TaxID=1464122 RepID=A0A1G6L549_9BACI|nr:DUF368 domain-containing protein [Shouchella lonarensis]SDC38297.1 putative membrane protein [Shouchella lonarensis]
MFIWSNIFRGIAMGVTELVPGVSGSTVAMFMGVYERLLQALNDLTTRNWKRALGFLIPLGLGMGCALLLFSHLITYLGKYHKMPLFYLFVGLILGILPFLWRSSHIQTNKSFRLFHLMLIFLSFTLVALLRLLHDPTASMEQTGSVEHTANMLTNLSFSTYLFLFAAGWIASTALVLPGVSGALMMIILGAYDTATIALKSFHIPVIFTIGLGVCAGIFITSRVIRFFFNTYTQVTYAVMLGLVAGSIVLIFPVGMPYSFLYGVICILSLFAGFMTAITFGKVERT